MLSLLIPEFAIPQFINHIPLLCLCDLVAKLLQDRMLVNQDLDSHSKESK